MKRILILSLVIAAICLGFVSSCQNPLKSIVSEKVDNKLDSLVKEMSSGNFLDEIPYDSLSPVMQNHRDACKALAVLLNEQELKSKNLTFYEMAFGEGNTSNFRGSETNAGIAEAETHYQYMYTYDSLKVLWDFYLTIDNPDSGNVIMHYIIFYPQDLEGNLVDLEGSIIEIRTD